MSTTNCRNCGAPPRDKVCPYCQTPLGTRSAIVDHVAFARALKALQACDWDAGRVATAHALSRQKLKLTAGQVRALADTCDWDTGKLRVIEELVGITVNPAGLLEAADIFDWDSGRGRLMDVIVQAGVDGVEDDIEDGSEAEKETPARAVPTTDVSFRVNGVLLVTTVVLIGYLLWDMAI